MWWALAELLSLSDLRRRYLGGQRLPVPKPSDCGPGFASGRAAPAQVGPDVGFRVCDHLQPLRLSCKGAREVAEPRRSDERFVVPGKQKDAHCVISAGRFIYHSVFHHSNSLCLLCSDAKLSPLWVWLQLCMWTAQNYGRIRI